ncbi:MAG: peptidylprolyl isomerase [Brevinemataceae bacterium]
MFKPFKITIALFLFLTTVSCGNNGTLGEYELNGKVLKVSIKESLDDMKSLLGQVDPSDLGRLVTDVEFAKDVIFIRSMFPNILLSEAQKISNYTEDANFIQMKDQRLALVPFRAAIQKGQEQIQKQVDKQTVEIAEVSRIMFTNTGNPDTDQASLERAEEIVAVLSQSSNVVSEFAVIAEKESHEPLGYQNGGYLNNIIQGAYPALDEVVFVQKKEGLIDEVIVDDFGTYVVLIHAKAKKVKVSELNPFEFNATIMNLRQQYINSNIQLLFTQNTDESILLSKKEIAFNDVKDDAKVVKFWNKAYTLGQIKEILTAINNKDIVIDNNLIFSQVLIFNQGNMSQLLYQLAIILKTYSPSFKNSKEVKIQLDEEAKNFELETAQGFLQEKLMQQVDTNVTQIEIKQFYDNNPTSRPVASFDKNEKPIYKTLAQSQDDIKRMIINQRSIAVEQAYKNELTETYKIKWDEKGLAAFQEGLNKELEKMQPSGTDVVEE